MSPSRQTGLTLDRVVKLISIFSLICNRVNRYRLRFSPGQRCFRSVGRFISR
jgi:hypothetical protein